VNNESDWSLPLCTALSRKLFYLPLVGRNFDVSPPYFLSGDFDSGTFAGWDAGGALSRSIVEHPVLPTGGTPSNPGTCAARLGNPSYEGCTADRVPIGQAYIRTHVIVPTGTPHLRFDYRVLSWDTAQGISGEPWDRLEVQVNGALLARYGDPDPGNFKCTILYDSGWQTADLDLSAYAGQTVLLTFFNENHYDGWYNTWSYLDNIRVEAP
jgi:hypothetical protein